MVESLSSVVGHTSRTERVAARRVELLGVAWAVIAVEGDRVSMDRIASAAGITRPVLYRHFGDISGLYLAIAERFADLLYASFDRLADTGAGRPLLRATVDAYVRTIEAHPQVYRYLTRRTGSDHPGASETVRDFARLLGERVTEFLTVTGLPAGVAALRGHALVGSIEAVGDWWLDTSTMTRDELVEQLTQVLWAGHSGPAA